MELAMEILEHIQLLNEDPSLKADGNIRSPEAVRGNISELALSLDAAEFYTACTHFYSMPRTQSVPALISALENLNPQIIRSAAVLLSILDAREAVNPMIDAFKSKHAPVTNELMRSLIFFGKGSLPGAYDAFVTTASPKIRRDSLATILRITDFAVGNFPGSHKICSGKPLTIRERRYLLSDLSADDLLDYREMSREICSLVKHFGSPEKFFLTGMHAFAEEKEIAFIEKSIGKKISPETSELPKPKVFRPNFKRNRVKGGAPHHPQESTITPLRPLRRPDK